MKNLLKNRGSTASLLFLGVVLLTPLFYAGCNYQVQKAGGGNPNTVGKLQPSEVPDFATVYQTVFSKYCQDCHKTRGEFLFDDYAALVPHQKDVRDSVMHQGTVPPMPKAPMSPLSDQDLKLLIGWIDAGAPKDKLQPGQPTPTPGTTTPPPIPQPDQKAPKQTVFYKPGDALPNYENLKTFVLNQKCIACHDSTDDELDLSQYSTFAGKAAKIKDRILRPYNAKGHMPKFGKSQLTQDEVNAIAIYVDGGAPENGAGQWQPPGQTSPAPAPSVGDLQPTYASISANIFQPKCIGCHTAPKVAGKVYPLGDLAGILQADNALTQKDAVHNKLIGAVTRTDEDRMPPPKRGDALTQSEVEILKQWISLGCPP